MSETSISPRSITTKAERLFLYRNSTQIWSQTGFQGHLRGDFDNGGERFYTSFDPFKDPYDDGFKGALQTVIESLRSNSFLRSFKTLRRACFDDFYDSRIATPWGRDQFAVRVDYAGFTFLFRLLPDRGDDNVYVWCFRTDWLSQHLEKARNGIRFVDTCGSELFRLEDGGTFRTASSIPDKNGNRQVSEEITARYVDDYHFELSSYPTPSLYHISQYAEMLEKRGETATPGSGVIETGKRG